MDERLGTERMLPLIFKMALPSVAAQLVNLLYGLVDRIYVGHIAGVGKDALAGVGLTSALTLLIAAFASLVGGGGAPLAAIALGRGDRKQATSILQNAFVLLLFFSLLSFGLVTVLMKPALALAGASEVTMPYAKDYLSTYLLGTVFILMASGLNTFISAQGRPGIAMCSVLIGALINTALDPLFIFTFDMGVRGAALASVIAQAISAGWVLSFLFSSRASLRIVLREIRISFPVIGKIVGLGVAPFVMAITESIVGFVLNGRLSDFGDIYVSSLAIMQSAMQCSGIPMAGFTQGVSPIISYNYGHGNTARVKQCFRISLLVMFTFNFTVILTSVLCPGFVASLFTKDGELIDTVVTYMPWFLTGMLIFGLQRTCQTSFVALGQAKISLFIALLRKVILLVPLALIFSHFLGVKGVFLGESVADATCATLCTTIFFLRFPKILRSAPPPPEE